MFGFLVFKGPYLRLYALLAVILMERRNMDSMFASMINNSPFSSDLEENDPFYRKVESVEVFLQQAYEVVNKLGNALYDETSLAALVEVLPQEIGFDGLKRETQEQLLELIRLCYKCTPNSDYRGWYPNEGDQLIDDFEFRESSNEVD